MNERLLRSAMVAQGVSPEHLMATVGISKSAYYRKMNGTSEFTQSEISKIAQMLHLDEKELCRIFFADEVA